MDAFVLYVFPLCYCGRGMKTVVSLPEHCSFSIFYRDHFFDSDERRRTKGKAKEGFVSTGRNAVLKGTLGVRWEKARINQSKMRVDRRMGLTDQT